MGAMPNFEWAAAKALSFVLYYSGGLWAFERIDRWQRTNPRCTVVNYHRIVSEQVGYRDIAVDPVTFRSHLEYMVRRGYRFLSLEEHHAYLAGRLALGCDSILLTFDDGYVDNYTAAFPELRQLGIPAVVFLCTGPIETRTLLWWDRVVRVVQSLRRDGVRSYEANEDVSRAVSALLSGALKGSDVTACTLLGRLIDMLKDLPAARREPIIARLESDALVSEHGDPMMTWEMVREMSDAGIAFGAHSVTHPVFSQLTPEAARFEILESKRCIEERLDEPVTAFAYPYGKRGYFDTTSVEALRACGLAWAYSTENGVDTPQSNDPYVLRRNGMRDVPEYVLAVRLAGVFESPVLAPLRAWIEKRRTAE